jgi:signal transduction histidine kinase
MEYNGRLCKEVIFLEKENNSDDLLHVTSIGSAANDVSNMEQNYSMILRNISHEFGNILTLINSSLQIIESSHPEVRAYKYWNSTMSDVHYMKDLVNELISFNNSSRLNINKIDINILIENILESFSLEKKYENISFYSSVPDSQTIILYADYVKLKQALINLVKNACESLEEKGKINITVKKYEDYITIAISDNGCGIGEDILENIFVPMFTSKINGSGLGLAITKKIINAHNGKLEVSTKVGEGSTFTITLPIQKS